MSEQQQNQVIQPADFKRAAPAGAAPRAAIKPVAWALGGAFLALGLVALFLFNARSVGFASEPAGAEMALRGLPSWQLGERYLMLQGRYEVTARLAGYTTLRQTVEVGEAQDQEVLLTLVKAPGELTLVSTAPAEGAEVLIDQQPQGSTPLVLQVAAGAHELAFSHPRYQPYETQVEIEGMGLAQSLTVSLQPAWANISVTSQPDGARVLVDGEASGQSTPAQVEALQGWREISLEKPGYKPWREKLQITAQQDLTLPTVALVEADGQLQVATEPAGAFLTIGGRYRGQTPAAVALPPRASHELLVSLAGYQPVRRTLAMQPAEARALAFTLEPLVGLVKVAARPAGALLYVNDAAVGAAGQTLELTAVKHRLRLELAGHAPYETEVTPQPGLLQEINVTLKTLAEAKAAAIPKEITAATGELLRLIQPGAGRLTLGAGRREPGRRSNEALKEALLTRAFYIGEKEVSNRAFKRFQPSHDSGVMGRALLSRDERPVVNISWEQAVEFCNWLSQQDGLAPAYQLAAGRWRLAQPVGQGYRLPTEAEWAWVARYAAGPRPSRFPWGDAMPPPPGAGNFADEMAAMMVPNHIAGYADGFRGPAPPGSYAANPLGLYDLAGNVSEWVHDYYTIEERKEAAADPLGPETGDYHVIRGSNYAHGRFSELRWTFRDYGAAPRPDVGFRIARYLQ